MPNLLAWGPQLMRGIAGGRAIEFGSGKRAVLPSGQIQPNLVLGYSPGLVEARVAQ